MKKLVAVVLMLAIVVSGVSAFAASTATSVYNESKSTDVNQYFTTSGKIENGGNGFVSLLVTTDGSVNVNNIMYIDQTVADQNGNFSFTDYIPKINVPQGKKYTVKVGATNLPAAISGGYLEVPEVETGHVVSGSVASQGNANATLEIKKDGNVVASATADSTGAFSIKDVADGDYYMVVNKKAHLSAVADVKVSGGNITVNPISLLAGDLVKGDNEIGFNDLSLVIDIYGVKSTEEGYKTDYDMDDDNEVGFNELSAVIDNYGAKADPRCYE